MIRETGIYDERRFSIVTRGIRVFSRLAAARSVMYLTAAIAIALAGAAAQAQVKPAAHPTKPKAAAAKPAAPAVTTKAPPARSASGSGLVPFAETLPGAAVKVQMAAIPAGALTIGGKRVGIKAFWIASTETPWEAYDAFTSSGPASPAYDQTQFAPDAIARPSKSYILPDLGWGHHGFPAINISFLSATMYCRWLASVTGKKYRLPTEAEWEYACRAGAPVAVKLTKAQAAAMAWYDDNTDGKTQVVAKKQPNAWKLYDMIGNVGEWATDAELKPVLCGPTFKEKLPELTSTVRKRWAPAWQATDPQLPKSRWWLSDGFFVGFRAVCEP